MSINAVDHARAAHLGDASRGLTGEPEQADVDLFNAAMRQHAGGPPARLADAVAGPLMHQLEKINDLSEKANRAVKSAAGSLNPMDMLQMNRSLSAYYLQSALTAKVVSKGGQALDKLTNMQ